MAAPVEFNLEAFKPFIARLKQAASGDFKKEIELFMEGLGTEFLRVVEDEIIRRQVMDTRLLLASFHEGGDSVI